ncbi:conserved hypothetical protein [Paraburkholderia tropica]
MKPLDPAVARPIALLARADKLLARACLDGIGDTEDTLGEPRFLLVQAQKAIDGITLSNSVDAIQRLGEAQAQIARMLLIVDSVLPRQSREFHMAEAAPKLAPLFDEFKPLIELLAAISPHVSPLAGLYR